MKAAPILIVTNAIALGLVAILFLKQEDLKTQIASKRTATRSDSGDDSQDLQARLNKLEERLRVRASMGEDGLASAESGDVRVPAGTDAEGGAARPTTAPGEALTDEKAVALRDGEKDPVMEDFRKKVALAQELNQIEQRANRVKDRLDELASDSKIARLSDAQKDKIVKIAFAASERQRDMWRNMRGNTDLEGLSRDERREHFRTTMEEFRTETQKQLEEVVPAADAKTLVESNVVNAGGGRSLARPTRRGGNRTGGR